MRATKLMSKESLQQLESLLCEYADDLRSPSYSDEMTMQQLINAVGDTIRTDALWDASRRAAQEGASNESAD